MRGVHVALVCAWVMVFGAACAWMNPLVVTPEARSKTKVALTAYEAMQEGMLIYGHMPACDPEAGVVRICRDAATWNKIKIADKLAVKAINAASPVLQGDLPDSGEVIKALIAIDQVKGALKEAQLKMQEPKP